MEKIFIIKTTPRRNLVSWWCRIAILSSSRVQRYFALQVSSIRSVNEAVYRCAMSARPVLANALNRPEPSAL